MSFHVEFKYEVNIGKMRESHDQPATFLPPTSSDHPPFPFPCEGENVPGSCWGGEEEHQEELAEMLRNSQPVSSDTL